MPIKKMVGHEIFKFIREGTGLGNLGNTSLVLILTVREVVCEGGEGNYLFM